MGDTEPCLGERGVGGAEGSWGWKEDVVWPGVAGILGGGQGCQGAQRLDSGP